MKQPVHVPSRQMQAGKTTPVSAQRRLFCCFTSLSAIATLSLDARHYLTWLVRRAYSQCQMPHE